MSTDTALQYGVAVNGVVIITNLPSSGAAERIIEALPSNQKVVAEVVLTTNDGRSLLLG